jgi:DMSO/TMAO reductase YedYZ molybdopterin-dependent catalytic subunit
MYRDKLYLFEGSSINRGRTFAVFILFILILLAFVYAFSSLLSPAPLPSSAAELREYQGQKLSSINDFRENSIKGPQQVDINTYTLSVAGMVNNTVSYSYEDVLGHQSLQKVATLHCVEGWDVTLLWEGVLVRDLIAEAGPKPGAKTVIFYAADGYSTSLPLDYIQNNDIMLAYRMNDVQLPPERGYPFQLVAEGKWGYKWLKWVTRIELSDQDYRGFWEQRGYSNDGDLNASFIG